MIDNKTALDRLSRIEQRIGTARPDHMPVWLVRAGESNAQAVERARLAGYASIGLLLPDDLPADQWEIEARAHAQQQQKGNPCDES